MWATLWLSSAVVFTLGHAEMTPATCNEIVDVMRADITAGIVERDSDGDGVEEMWVYDEENNEYLPWQSWEVTCEETQLPIGYENDG